MVSRTFVKSEEKTGPIRREERSSLSEPPPASRGGRVVLSGVPLEDALSMADPAGVASRTGVRQKVRFVTLHAAFLTASPHPHLQRLFVKPESTVLIIYPTPLSCCRPLHNLSEESSRAFQQIFKTCLNPALPLRAGTQPVGFPRTVFRSGTYGGESKPVDGNSTNAGAYCVCRLSENADFETYLRRWSFALPHRRVEIAPSPCITDICAWKSSSPRFHFPSVEAADKVCITTLQSAC